MDFSTYWENVENVQPVKEGRRPAQVATQGQIEPGRLRVKNEAAKQRLEHELHSDDPLQGYVNYIRTLKELHPSGGLVITKALEEATKYFYDMERFKNDQRLLNIYLELADKQSDPRETFAYMKDNRIGEELTNFHLAMAAAFERAKDYDVAERCYAEAVNVSKRRGNTADFDLAMKHLTHYKRRSARRLQEARAVHGPSSPQTGRALRVAMSAAEQHARHQQQMPPPSARGLGVGGGSVAFSSRRAGMPTAPRAPQFSVYDDRKMGSARQARPVEATWHHLETENTGVENHGPAVAWTDAGTLRSARAAPAIKQPSFSIWTEPNDSQPDMVEAAATRLENMQLQEAFSSTGAVRTPSAAMGQATSAPLSVAVTPPSNNQDDRTINTRMALNDMFEMFASPSMSVARPAPRVQFPMYTPAIGLANRLAEDEEGQNISPNVILRPGETAATLARSARRRPMSARPPLAVLEHHEEGMSPSFRREIRNPPPPQEEGFSVFRDTPSAAREQLVMGGATSAVAPVRQSEQHNPYDYHHRAQQPTQQHQTGMMTSMATAARMRDPGDETVDGRTLGISRVLAFDQPSLTVNRPRTARMMQSTRKPEAEGGFHIFQD